MNKIAIGPTFLLASFVIACSAKVARLPIWGETLEADDFLLEPGGKGLNVAIGVRRLGAPVDGLVAVGSDRFGALAREVLAQEGLPAAMLVELPGRTGSGIGLIDRAGENIIAVFPGANALLSARDIAAADHRLIGAALIVGQFEIGDAPIVAGFARARQRAIPTLLNPSPYRPIARDILDRTDMIVVNAAEGASLCADLGVAPGAGAPQWAALAERLFDRGVAALVVTLGAHGAELWRPGAPPLRQPAFLVAPVDTIGAGDAFLAGLIVGLHAGRGWPQSLREAAACGAIVAARAGVLAALPDRAQLEAFLAEHGRRPPAADPAPARRS